VPGSKREGLAGPWPRGVNNKLPDRLVPDDALRNAVDVELTAAGTLRRRDGYTLRTAGSFHSLWAEDGVALAVKNGSLVALDASLNETVLQGGLSPTNRMAYLSTPLGVYFSNGVVTGRYVAGAVRPWGIEHAHAQPRLTAIGAGGLDAGRYQVAITYLAADGEEGGTTTAVAVDVTSGGGIRAAAIPQPAFSGVTHIALYVTQANGDTLYYYGTFAVGTTSVDIARSATLGRQLSRQFLYPMPAGTALEEFNGRLYAAVGNQLWYSEPYDYGQRSPGNFFLFPEAITIVSRAGSAGIHVASDQHYLMSGTGPETFSLVPVLERRGVRGTLTKLPNGVARCWVTEDGMTLSPGDGSLEPRLDKQLVLEESTEGAVLYKEQDGEQFIIASLLDGTQSAAVAGDFVDAEVIRRS
jgi:hypothetical protein